MVTNDTAMYARKTVRYYGLFIFVILHVLWWCYYVYSEPHGTPTGYSMKQHLLDTAAINIDQCRTHEESILKWGSVPVLSRKDFPRILNDSQTNVLFKTAVVTMKLLDEYGVHYVMSSGTLLGSVIMHSFLPWDDDFDLLIDRRQFSILQAMNKSGILTKNGLTIMIRKCSSVDEEVALKMSLDQVHTCPSGTIRIHVKQRLWTVRDTLWNWPFVDLDFNSDEPIGTNGDNHRRPFCGLWLPSPADPWKVLSKELKTPDSNAFECKSKFRGHVNLNYEIEEPRTIACNDLGDTYPFVHRTKLSNNCVQESVILGKQTYYSVMLNEKIHKQLETFGNYSWD